VITVSDSSTPSSPSASITKYEPLWGSWYVEELIGEGSFGKVYKICRREYTDREFSKFDKTWYSAVKLISVPQDSAEIQRMRLEGLGDSSIQEFFREFARNIISEIDLMREFRGNSNIVSIEDYQIIDKALPSLPSELRNNPSRTLDLGCDILIRMELLKSLPAHVAEKPPSVADVVKLGVHICRALELCALKNVIHRDIKAENIFVSPYGEYKLGDFGVARQIEQTMSGLSKKGTYITMAPEVFKGEKYGASVDTYALGIVMYTLLNQNRAPFLPAYPQPIRPHDRENALQRRMNGEPIPDLLLNDTGLSISAQLNALVLKACAYDRRERFSDPTVMRKSLEAHAAAEGYELDTAAINPVRSEDRPEISVESGHLSNTIALLADVQENTRGDFTQAQDSEPAPEHHLAAQPASISMSIPSADQEEKEKGKEKENKNNSRRKDTFHTALSAVLTKHKKTAALASAAFLLVLIIGAATLFLFFGVGAKPNPVGDPDAVPTDDSDPIETIVIETDVATGYGISVNSQIKIVLSDKEEAQDVLKELEAYYKTLFIAKGYSITSVSFEEKIEIVGIEQEEELIGKEEALQTLIAGGIINVIVQGTYEVTEETDFATETVKDSTIDVGPPFVRQEGVKGTKVITWSYIARNGVILDTETAKIKEAVTKEPVKKIIVEGNKPSPTNPVPVSGFSGSYYKFYNTVTGYVMDANAYTMYFGCPVRAAPDQGGSYLHRFRLLSQGGHCYYIQYHENYRNNNGIAEFYLNHFDTLGASSTVQKWYFFDMGNGEFIIANSDKIVMNQTLVITTSNGNSYSLIDLKPYTGDNRYQRWKLVAV